MGEWRRVRIGDFLHRIKYPVRLRDDETYKLVTVRMHHKGVVLRETKKGKLIGSNMYQVRSGQFILSGIDARHGAFGVIPEELNGAVVTNDFWYFDVDDAVVARDFFLWLTTTPLFLDACIKSSEGTTNRRRLQAERFFNFAFRFPDVAEQHRLAERFASFDASHTALKSEFDVQSDFLKQLRQAVLQEAVEGKLTADWRTKNLPHLQGEDYDFPPPLQGEGRGGDGVKGDSQHDAAALLAQIKAEKERLVKAGKIRKEKPLPPIADSDKPFELPAGWLWCRLTEICDVQDPNPSHRMPKYVQSGVPFISPMNVDTKGKINFSIGKQVAEETFQLQCQTYSIMSNSFAFSRIGTIGFVFNLPLPQNYCLSHSLSVITPIQDESEYLMRLLSSPTILRQATHGVTKNTVPDLGMKTIRSFVVPLPPLAEQQAIVARVDSLMTMIDELERQVVERKEQAQLLMQAVLREAFSGGEGAEADGACVGATHASPDYSAPRATRTRHASPLREPTDKTKRAGLASAPTENLPLVAEISDAYKSGGPAALPAANQPVPGGIPARILAAMQPGREYSRADLLASTGISEADWIWAIRQLKEKGKVVQKGEKRGARYVFERAVVLN